tara:strand:- start:420 stop:1034 length:615 start_codon:yes stop_codon:yes gene_type:complete
LIKRTSLTYINKLLSENPSWKILDIGCGYNANKNATTVCDIQDLSSFYKDKNFIKLNNKNLPFEDGEFDFVIASHVLEHVDDTYFFIKELERVSSKGYIEVPTILEDNLVFENKNDHLWHLKFDDIKNQLIISNRLQYFEPILTVSTVKNMNKYFRESMVLELMWEKTIDHRFEINELKVRDKISISKILKKYISKRLRMLFSK